MKAGLQGLVDYCCYALKPSKGLQTWDLLLRVHGLYSPKWQATTQLHRWARTGRCSHLPGLLVRPGLVSKHAAAIKATHFPAVASLQPAQKLTLFFFFNQHPGLVQLPYICFPINLNGTRIFSLIGVWVLLLLFFLNSGYDKHLAFLLRANLKIISICLALHLKSSGITHPFTSTCFKFNKTGTLLAGRVFHQPHKLSVSKRKRQLKYQPQLQVWLNSNV